jgi:hypothetical protein
MAYCRELSTSVESLLLAAAAQEEDRENARQQRARANGELQGAGAGAGGQSAEAAPPPAPAPPAPPAPPPPSPPPPPAPAPPAPSGAATADTEPLFRTPSMLDTEPAQSQHELDTEEGTCVICYDEPISVQLVHANETSHFCVGVRCAARLKARGDACPVCRAVIVMQVKRMF